MVSINDRNGKIGRAPGFEDRAGRYFERVEALMNVARDVLYARGYQPIETPLIEQTELFLRRSGGLLSSQLFDFSAPDGSEVSLRPELTAPVVRHVLEQPTLPMPRRLQYGSPIFRYAERPYDEPPSSVPNKRQFIQVGAELVGDAHCFADGETIASAYELGRASNIDQVSIRIGHVGLIREVLGCFELSERSRVFLANNVTRLAEPDGATAVVDEAKRLGLIPTEGRQGSQTQASAADLLSRLATGSVRLPGSSDSVTRRAEDIVDGLRRKVAWDANNADFSSALNLMAKLAKTDSFGVGNGKSMRQATPVDAVGAARSLLKEHGLGELRSLDKLMSIIDAAVSNGVTDSDISVDFGLSASIAYYSGMIFEVRGHVGGTVKVLGGGGRYDGLASALGSPTELPALGFALNLDIIAELAGDGFSCEPRRQYVVLSPTNNKAAKEVAATASRLRNEGKNVVSLFDPKYDAEAVARTMGDASVVKVGGTDVEGNDG